MKQVNVWLTDIEIEAMKHHAELQGYSEGAILAQGLASLDGGNKLPPGYNPYDYRRKRDDTKYSS